MLDLKRKSQSYSNRKLKKRALYSNNLYPATYLNKHTSFSVNKLSIEGISRPQTQFIQKENITFRTEIYWKVESHLSLKTLRVALNNFRVSKKELDKFSIIKSLMIERIALAVKCGRSKQGSLFIFYKGNRHVSEIKGISLSRRVEDLRDDWHFLKEIINESEIKYKEKNTRIEFGNNILTKKTFSRYLKKREVLAFLLSSISLPSVISSLINEGLSWSTPIFLLAGLSLWVIACGIGYHWEDEYALK